MKIEKLLIVEDSEEDLQCLAFAFRGLGYAVESAGSIAAAELVAKEGGIGAVVCDIRMSGEHCDHAGLLVIKMIQKHCPRAIVIVCSRVARQFENIARDLGAHEVITKKSDLATTAIEVDNHILRHRGLRAESEPFSYEALHILGFGANWVLVPLAIGLLCSGICWKNGFHLPLLTPAGSALLPLAVAAIFVLTISDRKGYQNPMISACPAFVALHRFKLWLLAVIGGGFVYDALKSFIFGP